MKTINLTQGKVALVDDEDYDFLMQWKWQAAQKKNYYYATTAKRLNGKVIRTYMHHILLNTPTGLMVDHIDHNELNNQKSNLRICTNSQNQKNQRPHGSSIYKGVSFSDANHRHIRVCIRINGKVARFCGFQSEWEAAKFYDVLARMYYGKFAHLNFKINEI